jgi:DNA mismatch repair protein MutS2
VDDHALRVLEFDKVLARLAQLTSFSAGRELALALRPSPDFDYVVQRQRLLAEALRLRQLRVQLNLATAVDVRMAADKAALGGVLDTRDLLAVAATQQVAHQARAVLTRAGTSVPLLAEMASLLVELPALVEELGRSIDPRGDVSNNASAALGLIRRDIRIAHDRLHAKLQEFLSSPSGRLAVQEPIVTLRDGRYVIPIKADFRGEVRGIVHDVSSSGATVFVEPLAVVDLANNWRELQIEEQREIERILRRLSGLVGNASEALSQNVENLAELDLLMAAARLAEELSHNRRTTLPNADRGGDPEEWLSEAPAGLDLREARHPLLASPVPS